MNKYECNIVYLVLLLLLIWTTVQEIELRSQFQTLKSLLNVKESQTETLKLNAERLGLLERLMIEELMPLPSGYEK